MRSQGISQFYCTPAHTSDNGMNHTCLCLPSRSWYSFTDPGGMEGWAWKAILTRLCSCRLDYRCARW